MRIVSSVNKGDEMMSANRGIEIGRLEKKGEREERGVKVGIQNKRRTEKGILQSQIVPTLERSGGVWFLRIVSSINKGDEMISLIRGIEIGRLEKKGEREKEGRKWEFKT